MSDQDNVTKDEQPVSESKKSEKQITDDAEQKENEEQKMETNEKEKEEEQANSESDESVKIIFENVLNCRGKATKGFWKTKT